MTYRQRTNCKQCGSPLESPGDYCLVCRTSNCDSVVIEITRERAELTMLEESEIVGKTTLTTIPETGEREPVEYRNYVGRIIDTIHRKRPGTVFIAGENSLGRAINRDVYYECLRIQEDNPVETVIDRGENRTMIVVKESPSDKIGGSHSTVIGGRSGQDILRDVASHPHVKKIIPGRIDAGGTGSQLGIRGKVTRADNNGNLRLLVRNGSAVQEVRIVTTAMNAEQGEMIRSDLNSSLMENNHL